MKKNTLKSIKFAEWVVENHYVILDLNTYTGVYLWNNEHRQATTKELYKIYKKEQQL